MQIITIICYMSIQGIFDLKKKEHFISEPYLGDIRLHLCKVRPGTKHLEILLKYCALYTYIIILRKINIKL